MHPVRKILSSTHRRVRSILAVCGLLLVQVIKVLSIIVFIITWTVNKLSQILRLVRSVLTLCLLICIPVLMIWVGVLAIPDQMKTSVAIDSERFTPNTEGKFVSVTGKLTAPSLSDPPYLAPVPYLSLKREVSMLSWVESSRHMGEDDIYEYTQEWRETPPDSSRFHVPKDHTNPPLELKSRSQLASTGKLGVYTVDLHLLEADLPAPEELVLTNQRVDIAKLTNQRVDSAKLQKPFDFADKLYLLLHPPQKSGNAIYYGGDAVGDIRIRYLGVPHQQVTLFAQVKEDKLVPYRNFRGDAIYSLVPGDRSAALREMENRSWILLGVTGAGFLILWMVVRPIWEKIQPGSRVSPNKPSGRRSS